MVRQCLPIPQKIYNITKRLKTPQEEVEQYFPGFLSFIDSTEQPIPRPAVVDEDRRKMYYSLGKKKKRHTVKNQLMMVNNRGYILHKANHKKGRSRHDYNIYKNIRKIIL